MSVKATSIVWEYYPEGGSEMMTALALADHADPVGGNIRPSVARVAAMTRQSERTIQYHIKAMVEAGWLIVVKRATGRGFTTTYRMPLAELAQGLVERVQNLHPLLVTEEGCNPAPERVQKPAKKGATAVAHQQVLTNTNGKNAKGAGAPSATTLAFKAYQTGIKTLYGVDYPPSAKANGQLKQLVDRLGDENARAVIRYFMASKKPYYQTVRHSLGVLLKDAEALYIDLQQITGHTEKPATKALVAFQDDQNRRWELRDYPIGEPEQIARTAVREHGKLISDRKPKYVTVVQGSKRNQYSIAELT